MRRFHALLFAAGLVAAPGGAAAGPSDEKHPEPYTESFAWSMGKGRLGLTVIGLTPELRTHFGSTATSGLLVGSVEPDSPAAKAGVKVGDVLASADGDTVDDAFDVRSALADRKKGDKVPLRVIRDRKPMTLEATLDADPVPVPSFDPMWSRGWFRDFFESFEPPFRPDGKPGTT